MRRFKKWTATPRRRVTLGLLIILASAALSLVFKPLALLSIAGLPLVLTIGQKEKVQWFNGKDAFCPACKTEAPTKVAIQRIYKYIPVPFVGPVCSRHIGDKYFLVCATCMKKHEKDEDLAELLFVATGGLTHAKEITRQEARNMQK